jgi:hypothetical protein
MSIFKQTLSQTIQNQLKARTQVVSGVNNNRSNLLPWYLSKNSWVRMTSMVNYDSGKAKFEGDGQIKVEEDGIYNNTELAKKNILEGGQLYIKNNNGKDIPFLRKNVVNKDGAYGGSFDLRGNNTVDPQYTRQFGIRPMPGITSVNLHTISAYGSLFETTVNFYAWDNHQLNELEILFMRPGYSVLLEWGWSQYINNNNIPTIFDGLTVPAFSNLNQQDIYDRIETLRIKNDHNYDGMLGYVKNFSWKMMRNGGYECSTTLISMGEVISSLKISTNNIKTNQKPSFNNTSKDNYIYDDFENIFISLKTLGEGYNKSDNTINEEEYTGKWEYDKNFISRNKIIEKLKFKGYNEDIIKRLQQQPFIKALKSSNENKYPEGKYYEYISLDVFVAIIDTYFNLQITSKKSSNSIDNMVKIIPPGQEDYCLASKDSISVDPSVCLVSNPIAFKNEFVKGLNPIYEKSQGVESPVQSVTLVDATYIKSNDLVSLGGQFYDDTLKVGKIGEIYVNIDLLLAEYKNIKNSANDDGVNLTVYFKNILNKISNALGGLNNFSLSTAGRDQNTLRIIDLYYLEQNTSKNKYEFDLMGLGSIVRDANVESQIFENQSTIVAIAAQSRANLGDLYNSTQVYLNAGITDRVALAKYQPEEENTVENQGNKDNTFYAKLFDFLLYVRDNIVGADSSDNYAISTNTSGTVPYTFLKQFMLKYNGELNFKALLPFKLNIKLDGIGGIVVGEVFKVKKDILPRNYADKNLGFVITKISHNLQNNDWETTLETQICILDHQFQGQEILKNVNRQGFGEFIGELLKEAILYPVLLNYIKYLSLKSYIGVLLTSYEINSGVNDFSVAARVLNNNISTSSEKEIAARTPNRISEVISKIDNNVVNQLYSENKKVNIFGSNNFRFYLEKWVSFVKNESSPDKLNAQFTPTKTYNDVLNELLSSSIVDEISVKISNNTNMFNPDAIWKNVFNNSLDNNNITLNNNINSELVKREIISSDLKKAYDFGSLDDGTQLSALIPVDNSFISKIHENFTITKELTGTPGVFKYVFNGDKELLKQWLLTLSPSFELTSANFDKITSDLFFYN